MVGDKVKKLNNQKIESDDRLKASLIFNDAKGVFNSEIADSILTMSAAQDTIFKFFKNKL